MSKKQLRGSHCKGILEAAVSYHSVDELLKSPDLTTTDELLASYGETKLIKSIIKSDPQNISSQQVIVDLYPRNDHPVIDILEGIFLEVSMPYKNLKLSLRDACDLINSVVVGSLDKRKSMESWNI